MQQPHQPQRDEARTVLPADLLEEVGGKMTLTGRREERRHRSNKDCSYGGEIGTLLEQEVSTQMEWKL